MHLRRLAAAMRDRGYAVSVISLATPGPVGEMLLADGFSVETCGGRGGWDFRVLPRLRNHLERLKPELVHSFLFHANVAARWAARACAYPSQRVLCEIQTVEVERRWHLLVDRLTYDGCRFTIGNSPSVVQHLQEKARIPKDRLRLVRGGVDPEPIRRAAPVDRRALGIPSGESMVFWAGRLDPVKGLDGLLDAFFRIGKACAARLFLAGGGSYESHVRRRINGLDLDDRVHLLGPRGDVPSLLRTADLFVFPSRTEGLPNAILEAMAAGCPIVTTDVPGCRDLIEDERTGLVVPYGDTAALASAMERLLADRGFARGLGSAASAEVDRRWHIRDTFDAYALLYRDVLSE